MNFVIGDIHGEYTKLKALVTNILFIDIDPTLIFIGDYTNKGENPSATLKYLTELNTNKKCIFLRGNHEYYWEALTSDLEKHTDVLMKYGAQNTIESIDKQLSLTDIQKILFKEFNSVLGQLRNFYVTENYIITHSGIPPMYYQTEIENIPADKFLFNRYDFISLEKLYFDKKVIFGHTGFYSPYYDGFKICIDTAACYLEYQPLTAFCTDQEFFINSTNNTIQLSEINKSFCPAIPRVKAWRQK
jgi:serine/threonine protein phosphatase 1